MARAPKREEDRLTANIRTSCTPEFAQRFGTMCEREDVNRSDIGRTVFEEILRRYEAEPVNPLKMAQDMAQQRIFIRGVFFNMDSPRVWPLGTSLEMPLPRRHSLQDGDIAILVIPENVKTFIDLEDATVTGPMVAMFRRGAKPMGTDQLIGMVEETDGEGRRTWRFVRANDMDIRMRSEFFGLWTCFPLAAYQPYIP